MHRASLILTLFNPCKNKKFKPHSTAVIAEFERAFATEIKKCYREIFRLLSSLFYVLVDRILWLAICCTLCPKPQTSDCLLLKIVSKRALDGATSIRRITWLADLTAGCIMIWFRFSNLKKKKSAPIGWRLCWKTKENWNMIVMKKINIKMWKILLTFCWPFDTNGYPHHFVIIEWLKEDMFCCSVWLSKLLCERK